MTAQHAPHTTPLWRQFLSLPHTRLGWWAVGLLISLVLLAVPFEVIPARAWASLPRSVGDALELLSLIMLLVVPLVAGVVGSLAVGAGERSLLVWAALVPAAIIFAGLTSIFREGSPWVNGSPGVLIWALIATSIISIAVRLKGEGERSALVWVAAALGLVGASLVFTVLLVFLIIPALGWLFGY